MNAKERRAAAAKERKWRTALDGPTTHPNSFVRCRCGSNNVVSHTRLDVTKKRAVAVLYNCRNCKTECKVTATRGQLELEVLQ